MFDIFTNKPRGSIFWLNRIRIYAGTTGVGSYVRKLMAPNTHMGTIADTRTRKGRVEYLFHQDSRFVDVLPDIWLRESAIEPCSRPKDDEVDTINAFKGRGFWFMKRVPKHSKEWRQL